MKSLKRILLLVLVASLLLAVTRTALGKASKIEVSGKEFICSEGVPERMWITPDGVLQIRGLPRTSMIVSDSPYLAGTNTMVMNLTLDLNTGMGHAFGTYINSLDGLEGTWEGRWTVEITPFGYTGKVTGHGAGDLEGLLEKVKLVSTTADDPDNPCGATEAGLVSGVILDPK